MAENRHSGLNRRGLLLSGTACAASMIAAPALTAQGMSLRGSRSAPDLALEQMIGEMLVFGFRGTRPGQAWPRRIEAQIAEGTLGGVLLLGYNVRSREQIKQLSETFYRASKGAPPLISLDHEGGRVQRLRPQHGFTRLPSARRIARRHSPAEATSIYASAARELKDAGINLNLAPVVDLAVNPANSVIVGNGRSYSDNPETVTAYAAAFAEAHQRLGVAPVLKHFPGHGSSYADSHHGLADISRTWRESELEPYRVMIRAHKAPVIMTGHLTHAALTGERNAPVTFSPRAVNGLLRHKLGFSGVVITDDLEMGAIRHLYGLHEALLRSVLAGHDLLLVSNSARPDPALPERARDGLAEAVEKGRLPRGRVVAAHNRIARLKAGLA